MGTWPLLDKPTVGLIGGVPAQLGREGAEIGPDPCNM